MKTDPQAAVPVVDNPGHHRVTGLYPRKVDAEATYEKLLKYGFRPDQLEIVATEAQLRRSDGADADSEEVRNDVLVDGAIGTAVGTGVGALGEAALAAANVSLFVASPVLGTLAMLGWGAALGGIIGATVGAGKEDTHRFADLVRDAVKSGHAVLIAFAESEEQTTTAQAVIGNSLRDPHSPSRVDTLE